MKQIAYVICRNNEDIAFEGSLSLVFCDIIDMA